MKRGMRVFTLVGLMLGLVLANAAGCGDGFDRSTGEPPGVAYVVAAVVVSASALPACSAAITGMVAFVAQPPGLWRCNGRKWNEIACSAANTGSVAYSSAPPALWACMIAGWSAVELPPGPEGPRGAASRIRMRIEPPGGHCASGGQRIEVGTDLDANGALDDAEVEQISYVCHGSERGGGAEPPAADYPACQACIQSACHEEMSRCAVPGPCGVFATCVQACASSGRGSAIECSQNECSASSDLATDALKSCLWTACAETCVGATCRNGVRDASESDVDCGGPCVPCAPGSVCRQAKDCASGACVAGLCAVPSCVDGVRNGGEAGVDCGGPCGPCASCSDGVQNGQESDVDCGGQCPACPGGSRCQRASDCASETCEGGRCLAPSCRPSCGEGDPCAQDSDCAEGLCAGGRCQVQCRVASDCPGLDGECGGRTCISGTCGFFYAALGTLLLSQTDGDCARLLCDGAGNVRSEPDPNDLPDLSPSPCMVPLCTAAGLAYLPVPAGTYPDEQVVGDCHVFVCDEFGTPVEVVDDGDSPPAQAQGCLRGICTNGVPGYSEQPAWTPCGWDGTGRCDGTGSCMP